MSTGVTGGSASYTFSTELFGAEYSGSGRDVSDGVSDSLSTPAQPFVLSVRKMPGQAEGATANMSVNDLVRKMAESDENWGQWGQCEVKEKKMDGFMALKDLDESPAPVHKGRKLDFGKSTRRKFGSTETPGGNTKYTRTEADAFVIESLAGLQQWAKELDTEGNPKCVPGSRYAGAANVRKKHSEGEPPRKLKHPNDVEGLFADKLAMAISCHRFLRFAPDGEHPHGKNLRVYPVFANVYSLGSNETIRSVDGGLKMFSTGIFHAGCEVHGCEYSFGGSARGTGLMRTSPKCCGQHEYLQTIYVGDTVYTPEEVTCFLRLFSYMEGPSAGGALPEWKHYLQEDPLDPLYPGGYGGGGVPHSDDTPASYFDRELGPGFKYKLRDGREVESYPYLQSELGLTAACRTREERDRETVASYRIGFMGPEYHLLNNNCCWCSDYLIKVLVRTTALDGTSGACCSGDTPGASIYIGMPKWVFSAGVSHISPSILPYLDTRRLPETSDGWAALHCVQPSSVRTRPSRRPRSLRRQSGSRTTSWRRASTRPTRSCSTRWTRWRKASITKASLRRRQRRAPRRGTCRCPRTSDSTCTRT